MDPSFGRLEHARARHAAMQHEAAVEQVLRDDTKRSPGAHDPLLARLGDALVATGARLQEHRVAPAPAPATLPATGSSSPLADAMPTLAVHFYQYDDGRTETRIFCRLLDPRDGSRVTALLQGATA